jgi:hypothetical protein
MELIRYGEVAADDGGAPERGDQPLAEARCRSPNRQQTGRDPLATLRSGTLLDRRERIL